MIVRVRQQWLEQLGAERRKRHHHRDRNRQPCLTATHGDDDERDREQREGQRFEHGQQRVGHGVDMRATEQREVTKRDGVLEARARHERAHAPGRGEPDQAQRRDAQRAPEANRRPAPGAGAAVGDAGATRDRARGVCVL